MSFPPIHVLGAGSIGLLWASSIRQRHPTYPLTLLLRHRHEPKIRTSDGTVAVKKGKSILRVPAQTIDATARDIRNLLVTTKSYQAASAIETVRTRLADDCVVYLLCNGAMSARKEVEKRGLISRDRVVLASTTHGAYREDDKEDIDVGEDYSDFGVVHAGVGSTVLEDGDGSAEMSRLWTECGLRCSTVSNEEMEAQLWVKMAVNCAINPLTALWRCRNGDLLVEPSFPLLLEGIVSEVSAVALASLPDSSDMVRDRLSVDALRAAVYRVIRETSLNRSSMCQDAMHGRRTEIDDLNGYVVRCGRALGLDCPENEDIMYRVRALRS